VGYSFLRPVPLIYQCKLVPERIKVILPSKTTNVIFRRKEASPNLLRCRSANDRSRKLARRKAIIVLYLV